MPRKIPSPEQIVALLRAETPTPDEQRAAMSYAQRLKRVVGIDTQRLGRARQGAVAGDCFRLNGTR